MKNNKIDSLLESLDAIAAYHNSYEYGLPLYDESVVEEMRNCVLEWIKLSDVILQHNVESTICKETEQQLKSLQDWVDSVTDK